VKFRIKLKEPTFVNIGSWERKTHKNIVKIIIRPIPREVISDAKLMFSWRIDKAFFFLPQDFCFKRNDFFFIAKISLVPRKKV